MDLLKKQTDVALIEKLERLVSLEKKTTAEILEILKEVDSRRLFLKLGFTSLFAYLTEGLGYPPASAQRRIESARLLREMPEISRDLAEGRLNLTQVSMLASGLKQKSLELSRKKEILDHIKEKNVAQTQKILAQDLDLPAPQFEKARFQKDESTRLELTLSAEQRQLFERVKELISHTHPHPTWSELFVFLGEEFLQRKDPLRKKQTVEKITSAPEAAPDQAVTPRKPSALSRPLRRLIWRRDLCCQWRNPVTKRLCGSTFQLQIDHIQPIWAGGRDEPENLRLFCSVHNRLKYRNEAGIRFA